MSESRERVAEDGTPLVKVRAEYIYAGESSGERYWAKPLGDDLYELRNVPWYAYRLNLADVVRAVSEEPELWCPTSSKSSSAADIGRSGSCSVTRRPAKSKSRFSND
jgi:hypothetical protein